MSYTELRVALVERGLSVCDLARLLRLPPSTLSGWLHRRYPAPIDLWDRIEEVLAAPRGQRQSRRARLLMEAADAH